MTRRGPRDSPHFWATSSLAPALRGGLAALAVKVYSLGLLYLLFLGGPAPSDYPAFLFLRDGESRAARLREIRAGFLERLAPYDGQFYLDISELGYRRFGDTETGRGPPGNYAFFPLYPAILGLARGLLGHQGGIAAAIALNVVVSSAAAGLLYRLAERLRVPAWTSVVLLLAFPTAVFQSLLYTESLFLAVSLGAALGAVLRAPTPVGGVATFAAILSGAIGEPLGFLGIQARWSRFLSVSFPHVLALTKILEGRRAALVSVLALFVLLGCLVAKGAVAWRFLG